MKRTCRLIAWILTVCLLSGMLPGAMLHAAAEERQAGSVSLTGNTGAELTYGSAPLSAEVDDNDLAIVEIRGNTVRVIGKENAVGVARLTVETSAGYEIYDIPIGYTTFVFDGDKLTVIPGSSSNYEVAGVNAADEEYLVGDANYPLPVSTDENGYSVFENTDTYKLCVGLKKNGGTYVFTGTGTDSCIAVKKAAVNPTTILLAGLDLTSSFTAPITIKKESTTTAAITALGGFVNTLTDAEFNNADTYGDPTEDGGDGTNAAYAESAVIKGKANSQLTVNGAGTLNLVCSTKNALKVGEYGSLTIDELTLNITSAKNGISSDNTMVINGGNISVTTSTGDCIRTDPDAVNAEAGCAANIVINGGTFNLQSASDGIQSAQDLTINGGDFTIKTMNGYNDSTFNKDTMSCKGIKGTNPSDDETSEGTNVVTINGGTFNLNTADDAIHSDGTIVITGGEFNIYTGDDGVHADTRATFGADNAADCKIHLTVNSSYEGLESKDVYIKSGCYSIAASDDGINAAGGSSNGTDPGGGGWDPWNPGGGSSGGDYELTISGGLVNVNCDGDGLDSNGALNITGGSSIVWAQSPNGDNSPLDSDGTMTVNGGMVFGGGTNPMNENPSTSTSQPYVKYGGSSGGGPGGGSSSSTISSGKTVVVKNASSQVVFSIKAPKNINYAIYSAPTMTSSTGWSITSDTSTPTVTNFWEEHTYGDYSQTKAPTCTVPGEETAVCTACGHEKTREIAPTGHTWSYVTIAPTLTEEGYDLYTCSVCGGQYRTNFTESTGCGEGDHVWDEGTVISEPTCTEDGEIHYTCTVCGAEKTEAIPALGHDFDDETGVCSRCGLEAFRATFVCSEGCSVTVYRTQDLTAAGSENAAFAFPRSSADGSIDISGEGQVNFVVVLDEGYRVESIVAEPTSNYKNLKVNADAAVPNSYRVTKITGAITITVTATDQACDHEWDDDGVCIHCGVEAPKVVFTCDEGASITSYPTQDLTTGGVENATVALARDSATGEVDLTGNGQVNFVLNIKDGYELVSITPDGAYKNFKDLGNNAYRVTKITGTATVTVVTAKIGYAVHFLVPIGVEKPADMTCAAGESITLPTVEGPDGYTFLGWVTEVYDNVTEQPAQILTGEYSPEGETTLRALFRFVAEGTGERIFELVTAAQSDWTGSYAITYGTLTSMTLMKGVTPSSNGAEIETTANAASYADSGVSLDGTTLKNVGPDYIFDLEQHGSNYSIQNRSTGTYIGVTASSYMAGYTSYASGYCDWIPGTGTNASSANNANGGSYPYLGYTSNGPKFWTSSSVNTNIRWWKEAFDGIAYYTTIIGEEPHEHDWSEPTYEWAEDNLTCTATRTCACGETETETVETTFEVTTPAGCETTGVKTYTAAFENEAFATQTKTETIPATGHTPGEAVEENRVDATCTEDGHYDTVVYCTVCGKELSRETTTIPATGHDWDTPTYEWAADNSTVTATRVCKHDSSHVETETVETSYEVTTPATTTTTGIGVYTAEFENDAFVTQTKDVEIPMLEPTGYPIHVVDYTKGKATTNIAEGELYSGTVAVTVTCEYACAVVLKTGEGQYEKITHTLVAGVHTFMVDVTEGEATIAIMIRGDADLSGSITAKDATYVKQIAADMAVYTYDEQLHGIAADANKSESVTAKDATLIKQFMADLAEIEW